MFGLKVVSRGKGMVRESGMDMYTQFYLKWITNKDLLYSTGNSAQCSVAAWMGGEFRDSAIHICISVLPQTPIPSSLPHNIEQSSLCYTVGPCLLSILNIALNTALLRHILLKLLVRLFIPLSILGEHLS